MKFVRQKLLTQLAAVCLLLIAAGSLLWAFAAPVEVPTARLAVPRRQPQQQRPTDMQHKSDESSRWQTLFARRFQRPLYDPAPKPPPVVVKKELPPPPIHVRGTMSGSGGGHAMIEDAKGKLSVVPAGGTLEAGGRTVKILTVRRNSIDLEYDGKVVTLDVQSKSK